MCTTQCGHRIEVKLYAEAGPVRQVQRSVGVPERRDEDLLGEEKWLEELTAPGRVDRRPQALIGHHRNRQHRADLGKRLDLFTGHWLLDQLHPGRGQLRQEGFGGEEIPPGVEVNPHTCRAGQLFRDRADPCGVRLRVQRAHLQLE